MQFIIYWLISENYKKTYISFTGNFKKRIGDHQKGKVKSTKDKLPVKLVFKEFHKTKSEAQAREYKFKSWKSKKMIELIIKRGPIV